MRKILYLGTDPTHFAKKRPDAHIVHYPVIAIVPRAPDHPEVTQAFSHLASYTHILFTSKNAVPIFFACLKHFTGKAELANKIWIAIGAVTARALTVHFRVPDLVAQTETQEGLISLLQECTGPNAHFLLPRSSLSRNVLTTFFKRHQIAYCAFDLYDTVFQKPFDLDLSVIDEIVFTSPSTVRGFLTIFGSIPSDKGVHAQGPITRAFLLKNNKK